MIYDDKKFIGSVLKTARVKIGLSQGALAEKIGLSEKHISNIERGRNYPSLDTFFRLCEVLNLNINNFGVNFYFEKDSTRELLLQKIYTASKEELKAYSMILQTYQDLLSVHSK